MRTRDLATFVALTVLVCVLFSMVDVTAEEKAFGLDSQVRYGDFSKTVPNQLNYQGYLVNASDSSAVTATLEMTFRLFDSETKGTELWSETHPAVEVSNGLFQALLGSVTPFPGGLFDGSTLWLQTEVGAELLTPRKPLVSVAYSQRAERADLATAATDAQHAVHADTAAYTHVAGMTVADSAVVADNTHQLEGENLSDLDNRYVNDEDLDHLNAADGDPANAVYVDDAGNVGIGITSPGYTLDVNGAVQATTYHGDGSNLTGIAGAPDADWTINGDDIYHETGNVGIGTTGPTAPLTIHAVSGTDILFTSSGNNADIKAASEFRIGTSSAHNVHLLTDDTFRLTVTSGGGRVGIGTTMPTKLLDVAGSIHADTLSLGSYSKAGTDGALHLYGDGSADPIVEIGDYGDHGGRVGLYDEAANWTVRLEPDVNGTGGFLEVERSAGSWGFMVDGNYSGTEEPWVSINGSARSVDFYMSRSGDSSVVLPNSAISASEIKDEPGVSNSLGTDYVFMTVGNYYVIDSVDIDIPAAGYVEVTGGCYLNLYHSKGTNTAVWVSIDKTPQNAHFNIPGSQLGRIPDSTATSAASWMIPCTSTRLYEETSAGPKRYYLNARYYDGVSAMTNAAWGYVRAKYYPTLYGTVTLAETGGMEEALTSSQDPGDGSVHGLEPSRRSITLEDYNARLEAEMATLRSELDALKQEVRNQRR